jgi:hypothetical protein
MLTNRCNASVVADWVRVWRAVSAPNWSSERGGGHDANDAHEEEKARKEEEVRPEHLREIVPSLVGHRLELRQRELSLHWESDPACLDRRRRSQTVEGVIATVLQSI